MKSVRIRCRGEGEESVVICGKGAFGALARRGVPEGGGIVFTDRNVEALYGDRIAGALGGLPVHVMPAGEKNKNERTLFSLLDAMARAGIRRNSVLIAVGGGVVGDLGGLAAALYMRGIDCVQVPTTLLAQVDSSVGGKTAIDFHGAKNLVGAFRQPGRVYADPLFFSTLPAREIRCGLGEIVKHGALHPPLFRELLRNRARLTDPEFLSEIVPENIAFKASVVRADPHEAGIRKSLNLGHTTGHVLEMASKRLSHGECVLLGILFESEFARRYTGCDEAFLGDLALLCRTALRRMPPLPDLSASAALALLDKKNSAAGVVTVTAPVAEGKYELLSLPFAEYAAGLAEIKEKLC